VRASAAGKSGSELEGIEKRWMEEARLATFDEAVERACKAKGDVRLFATNAREAAGKSNLDSRAIATKLLGAPVHFDWEAPRTREGYYRYKGGTQCAINRGICFAPHADVLWMESKKPVYEQAKEFAEGVHKVVPKQWLAYNLSPSFNWKAAGMSEEEEESFIWRLGKLGFVWQFITLAGLHLTALSSDAFAREFAKHGMRAYVSMVQEPEREQGVEVLLHQKWSGAEFVDNIIKMVSGGFSSTASMGEGVTESQFKSKL